MRNRTALYAAALAVAFSGCSLTGKLGVPGTGSKKSTPSSSSSSGDREAPRRYETASTNSTAESRARDTERRKQEQRDKKAAKEQAHLEHELAFHKMVVIEPAPGVAKAPASVAIDWCGDLEPIIRGSALYRAMGQVEKKGVWASDSVLALLCGNPSDADYKKQAGYYVQSWMNETGLGAKEVIAHLRLRAKPSWEKDKETHCAAVEASGEASEDDKTRAQALRFATGCTNSSSSARELMSIYDLRGEEPTQTTRAALVLQCLGGITGHERLNDNLLLDYARCSYDIGKLSRKALEKELAASGWNDYGVVHARETFGQAQLAVARWHQPVAAKAGKDPAWKALLVEAPARAVKEHAAMMRDARAALATAAAYETVYDGPSAKANRGCGAKLRPLVAAHLQAARPKDAEAARKALTDPVGALLLARLAGCEHKLEIDGIAGKHGELALKGSWVPGPRAAIQLALGQVVADVKSDRERFPLAPKDVGTTPWSTMAVKARSYANVGEVETGVVKRVSDLGEFVKIELETERWKEPNYECKSTGKIYKIDENGVVHYHEDCWIVGMRWESKTHRPIRVRKPYADGVRKGSFIRFGTSITKWKHDTALGVILEAYKSKKQKKLTNFYGFEL